MRDTPAESKTIESVAQAIDASSGTKYAQGLPRDTRRALHLIERYLRAKVDPRGGAEPKSVALVIEFAFEHIRVNRLEARCAAKNGRGNKALRKVGAVAEGILRKAFVVNDEWLDQILYAIVAQDWQASRDMARAAAGAYMH